MGKLGERIDWDNFSDEKMQKLCESVNSISACLELTCNNIFVANHKGVERHLLKDNVSSGDNVMNAIALNIAHLCHTTL